MTYIRKSLYRFRLKNQSEINYVEASSLDEAARKLAAWGLEPDMLARESGDFFEEKQNDSQRQWIAANQLAGVGHQ